MYKTEEERQLAKIYANMITRCTNSKTKSFKYYGGKGITVCEEWMDRKAFILWGLSSGYKLGLSIDRIDPNLGYFPSNCRWVTKRENSSYHPYEVNPPACLEKLKTSKTLLRIPCGLLPEVKVVNAKLSYGRTDVQVTPVSGKGFQWVSLDSIKIVEIHGE